ncbi:MAG: hypothetical protein ABWW66_07000 [Archaeoglobaceae archaeon]
MFFTDWEGPWILNDFAYEICIAVLNNDRFFRNLSEFDDYLAYVVRKEGYEAGYTVKLIVPFLVAAGVTNEFVRNFAAKSVRFLRDAGIAMEELREFMPVVISTTYLQALEETAGMLGLKEHLHATSVDFDSLKLSEELRQELLSSVDVLASLSGKELAREFERIFAIPEVARILDSVKAIGAGEKAEILEVYCEEYSVDFPVAVGDSISDYKMFEAAKRLGGVAVAFNGNEYAVRHADVAVISSSAIDEALVVKRLLEARSLSALKDLKLRYGELYVLNDENVEEVTRRSKKMRVMLRSDAGELG